MDLWDKEQSTTVRMKNADKNLTIQTMHEYSNLKNLRLGLFEGNTTLDHFTQQKYILCATNITCMDILHFIYTGIASTSNTLQKTVILSQRLGTLSNHSFLHFDTFKIGSVGFQSMSSKCQSEYFLLPQGLKENSSSESYPSRTLMDIFVFLNKQTSRQNENPIM